MTERLVVRIIAAVVALAGALILIRSTAWGLTAGGDILTALGGAPAQQLDFIYGGPITAYRWLGALLLGVGLYRALALPCTVIERS